MEDLVARPTDELSAEYRRLAVAWGDARDEAAVANKIFTKHHEVAKILRLSAAGRTAIEKLLNDPEPVVRLVAATDALLWAEGKARQVLESLDQDEPGLIGFDAKWTLQTFDAGELNLDW